ncbi:Nuclear envelope morphology protein 1 [Phlyctema vagabunda]|uniref:Mitochondrial import inner membrane translocase subunit TIM50 n=1 Tax=Phlyctema vagabunda TaxID=108571 RepID=A0ABR4PLY0_9HELO
MNSLAAISARVSPAQTPAPSRSNSYGNILSTPTGSGSRRAEDGLGEKDDLAEDDANHEASSNEDTPLLQKSEASPETASVRWPKTTASTFIDSIRWVLSTIVSPGVYLIAWLYDENGNFAPLSQIRKIGTALWGGKGTPIQPGSGVVSASAEYRSNTNPSRGSMGRRGSKASKAFGTGSSSGLSSESESDRDPSLKDGGRATSITSGRHARSKSLQNSEEIAPARRSIRIKLHNEDSLRQRKHRKSQSTSTQGHGSGNPVGEISPATLKSPTSPASLSMTRYPRAPAPPRPLIPRRQPSYTLQEMPGGKLAQKTLILDLDETLIHSMAKGGRMSTGHMVEVKLNTVVGTGGTAGPQHPILYWVNKRPHCDDFLRRVSFLCQSVNMY